MYRPSHITDVGNEDVYIIDLLVFVRLSISWMMFNRVLIWVLTHTSRIESCPHRDMTWSIIFYWGCPILDGSNFTAVGIRLAAFEIEHNRGNTHTHMVSFFLSKQSLGIFAIFCWIVTTPLLGDAWQWHSRKDLTMRWDSQGMFGWLSSLQY